MIKRKILHTELSKFNDNEDTPYVFFNNLNRKEKISLIRYAKIEDTILLQGDSKSKIKS